jgi:hypothetical protein
LKRLRDVSVVADESQSERPLSRLPLARRVEQESGLRLIVPVNDNDLEGLRCDFCHRLNGDSAVLCLDAETVQRLTNGRGGPLIRREQEAAKGHAISDYGGR